MYSDTARRNDACPTKIIRFRHSSLIERTKRSAYAFKLGDRGGSRITFVPLSRTNARNRSVYFVSRSRIRYRFPHSAPLSESVTLRRRVGEEVTPLTPRSPGRAQLRHPVLPCTDSLYVAA